MVHLQGKETWRVKMEDLLSEDPDSILKREASALDEVSMPFESSIVLFGAGNLGKRILAGLRNLGIEPLAFADNNPALWNRLVDGLLVVSPQEAAQKFGGMATFVVSIWSTGSGSIFLQSREQLFRLGCSRVVSFGHLFWKYHQEFLPYYCLDAPHKVRAEADDIRRAFFLWEDDSSRREFVAQLRWRLLLDFDSLPPPVSHAQYFPDDLFAWVENEMFVDCGAFDGDTVRGFLTGRGSSFGTIIAIEPDPRNFESLQLYVTRLPQAIRGRVATLNLAVGTGDQKVRFDATGTASSAVTNTGSFEADCSNLDEVLAGRVPTYVKMDIEGAELDALIGAGKVIERHAPVLAICAYHRQNHLWQVPLLIRSLFSQYRLFLRSYAAECFDLLCYAVPPDRLKTPLG